MKRNVVIPNAAPPQSFGVTTRRDFLLGALRMAPAAALCSVAPSVASFGRGTALAATADALSMSPQVCVFSSSTEECVSQDVDAAVLENFSSDEYYSFCLLIENVSDAQLQLSQPCVSVDGGELWYWSDFALDPGDRALLHVFYSNMSTIQELGWHSVTWYANNEQMCEHEFVLSRRIDWNTRLALPSSDQIASYDASSQVRAPYLFGQTAISEGARFTQYSVDFKASYDPAGTYCCLAQWSWDFSGCESLYPGAHTETGTPAGYAGLQVLSNGEKVAILSLWDVFYNNADGSQSTIRAQLVTPQTTDNDSFGNEGTGAHCLVPYDWRTERWYRFWICRSISQTSGTVQIEAWINDLAADEPTLLCVYDTGLRDVQAQGPCFFFLENFDPAFSGEVRTMEMRDIAYLDADSGSWKRVSQAYLASNGGQPTYSGSYAFGAEAGTYWLVTTGVGGDWYNNGGQQGDWYSA